MNHLLLICATKPEWSPFKKWLNLSRDLSFDFPLWAGTYGQKNISLLQTGIGPQRARLVLDAYLKKYPTPSQVINMGLCGGLHPQVVNGDLLVISTIHEEDNPSLLTSSGMSNQILSLGQDNSRTIKEGSLFTSKRVLETPADKKAVFESSGATVVDMEAYEIASQLKEIPFAVVKAVFDSALDDVGDLMKMDSLSPEGNISLKKAATGVLRHPKLMKSLPTFQRMTSKATNNLSVLIKQWVESDFCVGAQPR